MASVWYIGPDDVRVITTAHWASIGITDLDGQTDRWDVTNGWSLPQANFNAAQIAWFNQQQFFQTGAPDGPQPNRPQNDNGGLISPGDISATRAYVDEQIAAQQPALLQYIDDHLATAANNKEYYSLPQPLGVGIYDDDNIKAILALCAQDDKACKAQAGNYRINTEIQVPGDVSFVGQGIGHTVFYATATGILRFGLINKTTDTANRYPAVGNFTVHGNSPSDGSNPTKGGITPFRIGHISASFFFNIAIQNCSSLGPAATNQTGQNSVFVNVQVAGNQADGWVWDLGAANNTLVGCIFRANNGRGEVYTRTGPTPAHTANTNYCHNFHTYGGLHENNIGGDIFVDAGSEIQFISAQVSGDSGSSNPAVWVADGNVATLNYVTFSGGQLRGKPGGICARVDRGTLTVEGNVSFLTGDIGVQVGDNGHLDLGSYKTNGLTTGLLQATGTKDIRSLVTRRPVVVTAKPSVDFAAVDAVSRVVPNMVVQLDARSEYEFELLAYISGDTANDCQFKWDAPNQTTMDWAAWGSAPTAAVTSIARGSLIITDTAHVGLQTGELQTILRGTVYTGAAAGAFQLRFAQDTNANGTASVLSAKSRLVATKVWEN